MPDVWAAASHDMHTLNQGTISSGGALMGEERPLHGLATIGLTASGTSSNDTFTLISGMASVTESAIMTIAVRGTIDDTRASVTVNHLPATLMGTEFVASAVPLNPGVNTITAIATDQAGNASVISIRVSVGSPLPPPLPTVGTLSSPLPAVTTEPALTLYGTKQAGTSIWINGQLVVPLDDTTTWTTVVTLTEGENNLTIIAQDAAGISSAGVYRQVILDTEAPLVTWNPPSKTNVNPLMLTGSVDDRQTRVTVNGIVAHRVAKDFDVSIPLIAGDNTLQLIAVSPHGHITQQERVVTLGTIPSIERLRPVNGSKLYFGTPAVIDIHAIDAENDPISYEVLVDGQPLTDWNSSTLHSWTPQTSDAGPHTLTVNARDDYGGFTTNQVEVLVVRPPIQPPHTP